jgi:hypothetical protein
MAREHGTRARYVAEKCRCDQCRAANLAYQQKRMQKQVAMAIQIFSEATPAPQTWTTPSGEKKVRHYKRACPGIEGAPCKTKSHLRKDSIGGICSICRDHLKTLVLVPALKTRNHLLELSRQGVGEEAVHRASGMATAVLRDIRQGKQVKVLPSTQRRVLLVSIEDALPNALVSPHLVWRKVDKLRREMGVSKAMIATAAGYKSPALQFKKTKVMAKSIQRVEEAEMTLGALCDECGLSHARSARLKRLERMLPSTYKEIYEAYPCTYPRDAAKRDNGAFVNRKLHRDLHSLGATVLGINQEWFIPRREHGAARSQPSEPVRTTPSSSRTWPPPRSTPPSAVPPPP